MTQRHLSAAIAAAAVTLLFTLSFGTVDAKQGGAAVRLDSDDIGGVVTGPKGPEAGVWVIAETTDLPTKFIKIVVTDDRGRYVLPDLPKATYTVWVRGYGLVDSAKVRATPGKPLDLTAVIAPDARAAAQYYPANYWYALLQPPPPGDFPGTGTRSGNGIPEALKTQGAWIGNIKMTNACTQCHQMGNKATRELLPELRSKFKSSVDAWDHRVTMGISGSFMASTLAPLGRQRALQAFADWTDRIAAGELPQVPPRPSGVERNLVISEWEWADAKTFVHDEVSTDKRNPTVNAYGPLFGTQELSGDWLAAIDPVHHKDWRVAIPPHDPKAPNAWSSDIPQPSPYWGEEVIWQGKLAPHNPMFDHKGRVWITARGGCRVYDPKADTMTHLAGCPGGHHVQIDDNDVLWFDGGGASYFDIRKWEKTGDDKAAGGRIPPVLDTNGNGKLDEPPVDAKLPIDPAKDKAINPGQVYQVIPNPVDGSIWLAYSVVPGAIVRIDPKTRLSEIYEVPYMNPKAKVEGYLPHGIDVDRSTGVIWTGLNSGHYAEFDRRKCKAPLNGPNATGQHCPEGWTLHQAPGPNFKGVATSGTADSYYLNWVDWFNTSGLGNNTPILNGSGSDALIAYVKGQWVTLRVPYPLSMHTRGMDGRIDDAKAGWKGRGLWTTHSEQATWHQEGGKGERPKVMHLQLRPDPLAK